MNTMSKPTAASGQLQSGNIMLQALGLSVSFGRLVVIQDLTLTLRRGERHALIGPNGAGKTTLINLLAGTLESEDGSVWLDGADVTRLGMGERSRRGLVRTFQINSLFPDLTPLLSLVMAISEREGVATHWWRTLRHQRAVYDEATYWLERLGLSAVADVKAGELPYGQQRLLEIALALACRPQVLLLDEPAAGLSAHESGLMLEAISALTDDISVLLIEHDMNLVFRFAETISVLAGGKVLACGTPEQIAADDRVREVYLGVFKQD